MWIITTNGFYSAVASDIEPDTMLVRCRHRGDAVHLQTWAQAHDPEGGYAPIHYPGADYPWRVALGKALFADFVAEAARNVDYSNFKSAVGQRQGWNREHVYHDVWAALRGIERLKGALGTVKQRKAATRDRPNRPWRNWHSDSDTGQARLFSDLREQRGIAEAMAFDDPTFDGDADPLDPDDYDTDRLFASYVEDRCGACRHVHDGDCAEDCFPCWITRNNAEHYDPTGGR